MVKGKDNPVKKETKNKETQKKNTSEKSSKESSAPSPKTDKSSTDAASNVEQPESTAANKENYARGESQKPVTKAYRNNWNRIFK